MGSNRRRFGNTGYVGVSGIVALVERRIDRIADLSRAFGRTVRLNAREVLDRSAELSLGPPGRVSPNGSCRLLRTTDGWIALNLARPSDLDLLPALIGGELRGEPRDVIADAVAALDSGWIVEQGALLGMAVSATGEALVRPPRPIRPLAPRARPSGGRLRVVDLSSLWAGPLCGAVLAAAGAEVVKVESSQRPDTTADATPRLDRSLNGQKTLLRLDFATASGRDALRRLIAEADVLITSARRRAFDALGLLPQVILEQNPNLLWVAVTGHGWEGDQAHRVGFGDDAAAAGGLVGWSTDGTPSFLSDALADPLTGLHGAICALEAVCAGRVGVIDAALSDCAAQACRELERDG